MKQCLLLGVVLLLAGCGDQRATQEWIDEMHAPESSRRLAALRALGESRGEEAVVIPALAEALHDADGFVRRDAAHALGRFGPSARPALPALRLASKDRNRAVRKAVQGALDKIDPEAKAKGTP